jgi:repressor LexA
MQGYLLTKKQDEVYLFIRGYIEKNNRAPYIREIQEGCGISSYKGAIDKLLALERKGYIQRKLNKHRSIELNKKIAAERM